MLALSLAGVFLAFCFLMGAVLLFCIRERRLIDGLGDKPMMAAEAIAARDRRIVKVLFAAMIAGAGLALLTGYLVFVRVWE